MTRRLVLLQLGALALAVAGLLPWTEGIRGYQLARAVAEAGGDVDGLPPALLGWAWFLLPALGFVAWVALWLPRTPPRRLHLVVGVLAALGTLVFLIAALTAGGSAGAGAVLAFVASALLITGDRHTRHTT